MVEGQEAWALQDPLKEEALEGGVDPHPAWLAPYLAWVVVLEVPVEGKEACQRVASLEVLQDEGVSILVGEASSRVEEAYLEGQTVGEASQVEAACLAHPARAAEACAEDTGQKAPGFGDCWVLREVLEALMGAEVVGLGEEAWKVEEEWEEEEEQNLEVEAQMLWVEHWAGEAWTR